MTIYEIYQCAECGKREAIPSAPAERKEYGWVRIWDLPDDYEQHPTSTLTYCPEHAADGLERAVRGPV